MQTIHSLKEQIEEWRRNHLYNFPLSANSKAIKSSQTNRRKQKKHSPLMLLIAIASLTSVIGYRFYNQPQLAVGTKAPIRIEAPAFGRFEDLDTTLLKRKEVEMGIVPVLKQDEKTTKKIKEQLQEKIQYLEQLRKLKQPIPFIAFEKITFTSQNYLLLCTPEQWQSLLTALEQQNSTPESKKMPGDWQKVVRELIEYRQNIPAKEFDELIEKIKYIRANEPLTKEEILTRYWQQSTRSTEVSWLDLDTVTWEKSKNAIIQAAEKILTQGIPPGLPKDLLEKTVAIQLEDNIPHASKSWASRLLQEVIQPNLIEDLTQTKYQATMASLAVEPEIVQINQGEVIVRAGEIIDRKAFVLLDGFGLSRRGINWNGLGLSALLVTTAVGIFWLTHKKVHRPIRRRDSVLLCLLSLTAPLLMIFNNPYTNLPAIGFLVSSFYNPNLAVTHLILLTGLMSFSQEAISWEYLLAGAVGGLLSAIIAGRLRSREGMARLGLAVGLTQGIVYFVIKLIFSSSANAIWFVVLPSALLYGFSGTAWIVIALGISPFLERLFDVVTPIRLAELSNPNMPLLKRLATEAPGTFQHTMFVASLAEAAAREINCNVELVRAGTLYHDIGKMHDALGFIENQMGGPNKHDAINNPWVSVEIIKKHVTEGLVMARKYGLPKAVRDFIPEHQGALLIAYFYYQAKQKAEAQGQEVIEADFRYDGPIPQSKETALVMLADGCEAALRSLKDRDVTPEVALMTIHKIFKARWREEQLIDSGLNWEELPIIAEVFVRVWQQHNHQRIAYPKAALDPQLIAKKRQPQG